MKPHTCLKLMVLAAHLCWLATLTGCHSGNEDKPTVPSASVRVVDEADGSPVADIKVMVMDHRFNIPVSGPFISDTDGLVDMGVFPQTDLSLMVFCGVGYLVHFLPGYGTWNQGASGNGLTNPGVPMEIQVRRALMDSLPRIAGKVIDSESGSPLNNVFVSVSPYLIGYQGGTDQDDDVTGNDGMFSVSNIHFTPNTETGNLFQVNPLHFTCYGYRPVVWKYDPPNGSDNVDISGVTIAMKWMGLENHRGRIIGLLMRDGIPAGGVAVGLGVVDQSTSEKSGPGMPGWMEVTDEFGRFVFGQVPPGTYILQPGFALGDGVYYPPQPGNPPITIVDGEVFNAGTLTILHEIEPLDPPHGQVVSTPPTSLSWTSIPGAATYKVKFRGEYLPLTTTNSILLPETPAITPGLHSWIVKAYNKAGALIGISQIHSIFRLLPPPD